MSSKGRDGSVIREYIRCNVTLRYQLRDLLWRPAGGLVRFVAVRQPSGGSCLLMYTDSTLKPLQIIRLDGLRFKIEHTFKQVVHQIGTFAYQFWMADMKLLRRRNGNQHLHRESPEHREHVKRKLHAYHVFIQAAMSARSRPVPRCHLPSGRLEFLRLVAAHHPPGHSTLRAGRRQRATPAPAGISVAFPERGLVREVHPRTKRSR